jgi:hypothetical protein
MDTAIRQEFAPAIILPAILLAYSNISGGW